ncbi:MAG: sialate O-acetylesterase [Bacteroidota bacterium]
MKSLQSTLILILAMSFPLWSMAQLRTSHLIGNHMVVQRNQPVALWGWAHPQEQIELQFAGNSYTSTADSSSGKWLVELTPMPASGPFDLKIQSSTDTLHFVDIWVGDVWICSGQSNMEWQVANSQHATQEMQAAQDRQIRHFKIPRSYGFEEANELEGGEWTVCTPETVGDFTAVGYFFARDLREQESVTIGLINSSWGGSRIEAWMSSESLGYQDPAAQQAALQAKIAEELAQAQAHFQKRLGEVPTEDQGWKEGKAVWAAPDWPDQDWSTMTLPGLWESQGWEQLDGVVWFRTTIQLSTQEAQQDLQLHLGKIDDSDITFVNGQEVGGKEMAWDTPRVYRVSASLLRPGANVIAIRVDDIGYGGGFHGEPELMFYQTGNRHASLSIPWRYKIGKVAINAKTQHHHTPTLLYHKMIHPILEFPIRGALWYQGESNASGNDAWDYRQLFTQMIEDWRLRWKCGDFPFLFVQLANFGRAPEQPMSSGWAVLRESQSQALALPNTGQAVSIDIGEAFDIHPRNKQEVGRRLSLVARQIAYGETLIHSGPVYRSMRIDGSYIRLQFDHLGSGLLAKGAKDGALGAFSIAGADRQFVWAQARIEGDEVVVWSDQVKNPQAVRYGWADNPEGVNLYNREGLPASPFRTDRWSK